MTTPSMQQVKCTIHNFHFAYEDDRAKHHVDPVFFKCPICSLHEMGKLRSQLSDAEEHRDTLLRAIEIKLTVKVEESK